MPRSRHELRWRPQKPRSVPVSSPLCSAPCLTSRQPEGPTPAGRRHRARQATTLLRRIPAQASRHRPPTSWRPPLHNRPGLKSPGRWNRSRRKTPPASSPNSSVLKRKHRHRPPRPRRNTLRPRCHPGARTRTGPSRGVGRSPRCDGKTSPCKIPHGNHRYNRRLRHRSSPSGLTHRCDRAHQCPNRPEILPSCLVALPGTCRRRPGCLKGAARSGHRDQEVRRRPHR